MTAEVAIVAALPPELAGVRARLAGARPVPEVGGATAGVLRSQGREVPAILLAAGMGRAAETTTRTLLEARTPRAIITTGFCGGCAADAFTGDLIGAIGLICEPQKGPGGRPLPGREPLSTPIERLDACRRAAAKVSLFLKEGVLVTVDVPASPSAKMSLHKYTGATACDMESFWIARLAEERDIPWACARAVFDHAMQALPKIPPQRTGRALLRRPWLLLEVPRLLAWYRRARAPLDRFLPALAVELGGAE